jgi:hypothetical protein
LSVGLRGNEWQVVKNRGGNVFGVTMSNNRNRQPRLSLKNDSMTGSTFEQ